MRSYKEKRKRRVSQPDEAMLRTFPSLGVAQSANHAKRSTRLVVNTMLL